MSGHNKWSTIKRKKKVNDQKKASKAGVLIKSIISIVSNCKKVGKDFKSNLKIKNLIKKSKVIGVSSLKVKSAIKKGLFNTNNENRKEFLFFGKGPEGFLMIIKTKTNNKNRVISKIRSILLKNKGILLNSKKNFFPLFQRKGKIVIKHEYSNEEKILDIILKEKLEDIFEDKKKKEFIIITRFEDLEKTSKNLIQNGIQIFSKNITYIPINKIIIKDKNNLKIVKKIKDYINNLKDVVKIYTNLDSSQF
jgi:YebC/PmpR family DNA-binding regulatory protein